jgi:hypothetical protein
LILQYERINGAVTATVHVHACRYAATACLADESLREAEQDRGLSGSGTSRDQSRGTRPRAIFFSLLVITRDTRERKSHAEKRDAVATTQRPLEISFS